MKGFIFDLDGTLSDTIPVITATAREAYARFGVKASDEQIKKFIGLPLIVSGENLIGPGQGQPFVDAYQEIYSNLSLDLHAFDGIVPMLQELRNRGKKLAVCTSKRRPACTQTIEMEGMAGLFDAVICFGDCAQHKPFAAPAMLAAKQLQLDPAECCFIGDSINDIKCGKAAGMMGIAVTYGAEAEGPLVEVGSEHICHSVAELAACLYTLCE